MAKVEIGASREERAAVTASNTAQAVGSGSLAVFATPAMLALMERAATGLLQAMLPRGWTSVGTRLDVAHSSATPAGLDVRAVATISGVNGRTVGFDVIAFDNIGEIGRGRHERVVVNAAKFMAKAEAKLPAQV